MTADQERKLDECLNEIRTVKIVVGGDASMKSKGVIERLEDHDAADKIVFSEIIKRQDSVEKKVDDSTSQKRGSDKTIKFLLTLLTIVISIYAIITAAKPSPMDAATLQKHIQEQVDQQIKTIKPTFYMSKETFDSLRIWVKEQKP